MGFLPSMEPSYPLEKAAVNQLKSQLPPFVLLETAFSIIILLHWFGRSLLVHLLQRIRVLTECGSGGAWREHVRRTASG
jgi:hypothetical protein